jgi:hypothetical protein
MACAECFQAVHVAGGWLPHVLGKCGGVPGAGSKDRPRRDAIDATSERRVLFSTQSSRGIDHPAGDMSKEFVEVDLPSTQDLGGALQCRQQLVGQ